ncbi:hypothetical protein HYS91_01375 [Candidatus Daviesbacteria bacterium]|nr:hypothetical protein [Candidatus Daviesbacteria bacterium]
MKIIVAYGSALAALNKKISEIKKDFDPLSVKEINFEEIGLAKLLIELASMDLFSEKRLVIVEDVDESLDINQLDIDDSLTLILKFSKKPSSKILMNKKIQVIQINEEKEITIFPLLNMLSEKNPKAMDEFEILLKEVNCQYILTMLFYMLRRLILNPKNTSSFIFKKIEQQKRNFPLEKLKFFYHQILITDYKIKQGLIEERLALQSLIWKFLA